MIMPIATTNRGSEWRKWDLHVHTPFSHTSEYAGATEEEKWENFIKGLEALPKDIKVIGINDYLFLDGYKKVLKYKDDGRLKNIDLILSNNCNLNCFFCNSDK